MAPRLAVAGARTRTHAQAPSRSPSLGLAALAVPVICQARDSGSPDWSESAIIAGDFIQHATTVSDASYGAAASDQAGDRVGRAGPGACGPSHGALSSSDRPGH